MTLALKSALDAARIKKASPLTAQVLFRLTEQGSPLQLRLTEQREPRLFRLTELSDPFYPFALFRYTDTI